MIYLIFDLFLLILFIEKKINTPSYLPDYIRHYLSNKQQIAKSKVEVIRFYIRIDLINILISIVIQLLMVIIYLMK